MHKLEAHYSRVLALYGLLSYAFLSLPTRYLCYVLLYVALVRVTLSLAPLCAILLIARLSELGLFQ